MMMARARRSGCKRLALYLVVLLLGCSSSTQFDGRTYRGDDLAFRVGPIPPSWRKIDVGTARLAFRDDPGRATIAVTGRCGKDGDDVPLEALTHHLFLQFTDREIVSQKAVPLAGREALRSEMVAELDGVPKRYVVYVLKKDGCVYDFMLISDVAGDASAPQDFDRFVQGFTTLG